MQEVEKFVELARKKFDSQPFIEDYLNKKLKYKELVGTYLYNQWVYTCQIEGLCKDAGLLEDIKEICIKENLAEAWKAEWPYDADDISKPWVEPSVMYATQSWCDEIHKIKENKDLLLAHLYASHSEIMVNQGTSVLKERLTKKFEEAYKNNADAMLEVVKLSWDFKINLAHDLEAHKDHMEEVLPRIAMFKIAAKEISEDKSGINDLSAGARDEAEDNRIIAELMANQVWVKEMDVNDVPEEYKADVQAELKKREVANK